KQVIVFPRRWRPAINVLDLNFSRSAKRLAIGAFCSETAYVAASKNLQLVRAYGARGEIPPLRLPSLPVFVKNADPDIPVLKQAEAELAVIFGQTMRKRFVSAR